MSRALPLRAMLGREEAATQPRHWVRLGTACSNRCLFCLDGETPRDVLFDFDDIVREIERGRDEHLARRLILSGGEPTIHPRFVDLIRHTKSHGYDWVQTITNGSQLADRDFFRACLSAGLDEVTFSLHGHTAALHDRLTRTPGSFNRLLKGLLRAVRDARLVVSVDIVLCRLNVEHLAAIIELGLGVGVREFDLLHIIPQGSAFEHREQLLYDPGEHLEELHRVFSLNRHPDLTIWTNRLPPTFLEGLEDLIQDPHKILDEVQGRRIALRRYLDHGIPLDCRQPERCRHCCMDSFCSAVDQVVADLREQRWDVWWIGEHPLSDAVPESGLPFGCSRVGLRVEALDNLDNAHIPSGAGLYLEIESPETIRPGQLPDRPVTLVATGARHLDAWMNDGALPPGVELEIRLDRDTATWMLRHRGRLAEALDRVRVHQPGHESLRAAATSDVEDPARLFEALRLALRVSGLPPCLAPGAVWEPAQRLLPQELFDPATGRLDLAELASFYIREHYRVHSLRCRLCPLAGSCDGIHINMARSQGLGLLRPLSHELGDAARGRLAEHWPPRTPRVAEERPPEAGAPGLPGAPDPPPVGRDPLETIAERGSD